MALGQVLCPRVHERRDAGAHHRRGPHCVLEPQPSGDRRKGETSGNVQRVVSITADCDADAWWWKWSQLASACHTGAESCFFNEVYVSPELKQFSWQGLYQLIKGRKDSPASGSYTTLTCSRRARRRS